MEFCKRAHYCAFWFSAESRVLFAAVIALSSIVFFSLIVNGTLIWRLRRAEPNNRTNHSKQWYPCPIWCSSSIRNWCLYGAATQAFWRAATWTTWIPVTGRQTGDPRLLQYGSFGRKLGREERNLWKCGVKWECPPIEKGVDHRYSPSDQ